MFDIDSSGGGHRLSSTSPLSAQEFDEVACRLGAIPFKARKIGYVAARKSERAERIDTTWNGAETHNVAQPGDWIVTNMSAQRQVLRDGSGHANTYVIKPDTFQRLYEITEGENEFGRLYKAKGVIDAVPLLGGFDIAAPWGERQVARSGYLVRNGSDVYGNQSDTFEATYERIH